MKISTSSPASRRSSTQGFTLVEIMIGVVVLGLLAALLIVNAPSIFSMYRVHSAASDYSKLVAIVADASSKCGGTLPITEGTSAITGLTSGSNLGSSTAANFYNNARLEQVLMAVPDPLVSKYMSPAYGSQSFARSDGSTGNDLTYSTSTGLWSNNGTDTTIVAGMSYANVTRLECAAINSAAIPGVDGTNFRLTGGTANLTNGGRVAYYLIKGMPGKEAYKLAVKLNGSAMITDTSSSGTIAQTNGVATYAASTSGTNDVYLFLGQF